ncbi:MAG TPA: hypothetical protein VK464_22870 [Symbiobacteriaceae bacterium]|nr:hypothetical protein [Symbiobacteriaceae bacterium]
MSKLLTGVQFRPHRVALIGALGGLLAYAGRDLPQAYVMGATGHAFRLTLDLVISPSAPVELNFHDVFPLWENLGAWFKRTGARPNDENFAAVRADVLQRIRDSVDRGRPAMAYDLMGLPEYGLVVGYDEDRLACLTLNNPDEPEWMAVSTWPPQEHAQFTRADVIELLDVAPAFDRRRTEVASLRFAVEHFWEPPSRDMWLQHGLKAYEFWISILTSPLPLHGVQPGMGHSYNLLVLQRARRDAAVYLAELGARYPEAPSLQTAAQRYAEVAALLEEATTRILPFPGANLAEAETKKALADCLRRAMATERQGVDEIERSLRALR